MTSREIRSAFLGFFEERGHKVVASHSIIPPSDPTLLFVNAGMVQFKDVFIGQRQPAYRRATTTQKCLRVSGKHNDLEQVGRTLRHHTFFEMLGNFSFGDYFKKDAIPFAWELLTRVYGLSPKDLWVTVHPDDDEARTIWTRDAGVAPDRVRDDPSNLWSMGETGPCGPCSEIHIDRGPSFKGTDVLDPGDRFLELWNLVFMQYDRDASGTMTPLPAPCIDTGMGLERICSVLQDVPSNYETDLFRPLMDRAGAMAKVTYGHDDATNVALRVIADHARATAFLISDGIYPENEGRGYVLRRLMRRAIRFGNKLGLKGPFFTDICLEACTLLAEPWPELVASRPVIERVAHQEEDRFLRTLSSGMDLLEGAIEATLARGEQVIDGNTVFALCDTHGFPMDLTELIASEHGLGVDTARYQACMEEQRCRGRASWKGADESLAEVSRAAATAGWKTAFVGYAAEMAEAKVIGLWVDGRSVDQASIGQQVLVVTDRSPFYGESGGQIGDMGSCVTGDADVEIVDAKRPLPDLIAHEGVVNRGTLKVGDTCRLLVNADRRALVRKNHSATHLLHHALREVLGTHVRQRGSLVTAERLRFDYSHTGPMTDEEIATVEDRVLAAVMADRPVHTDELPFDDAVSRGALHFFGDKYGDVVRLVDMGDSKELCGGTHVSRTGEIGLVKVVSETGVSAGVRRIEAVTGPGALAAFRAAEGRLREVSRTVKADADGLVERVRDLVSSEKALQKQVAELKVACAARGAETTAGAARIMHGIPVTVSTTRDMDPKALRELADVMRDKAGSGLVLLMNQAGPKWMIILATTRDLADRHPANRLLQNLVAPFGGRGGGSPTLAQGGVQDVPDPETLVAALEKAMLA